jgi:hypothetical protein
VKFHLHLNSIHLHRHNLLSADSLFEEGNIFIYYFLVTFFKQEG